MTRLRIVDTILQISVAIAIVSCGVALFAAWHWPLVGDAALMRYVVLLLHAGRAPYRQIVDINLPGSYLSEALAMWVFGAGAVGLRIYDGFLCLVIAAGAAALGGRDWRGQACGLLGGVLFVLLHLRDGVVEGGERDLLMAALVVLALVVLLRIPWTRSPAGFVLFELLIGATLTIKPTLLPLAFIPLLLHYLEPKRPRLSTSLIASGLGALLLPGMLVLLWLHQFGAIGAFLAVLRSVDAAHSRLAHQTLRALLSHAVAPVPAVFGLAGLLVLGSRAHTAETKLLLFASACGLLSFVVQWKGFPYQRYPFLALALILVAQVTARALRHEGWRPVLATLLILIMGAFLPPVYAGTIRSYTPAAPFESALAHALMDRHAQQGSVQCLDTVGGCINTLLDLHLVASTGYLYDCYAYQGSVAQQQRYRRALLAAIEAARPETIVLTNQFCLEQHYSFDRVEQWPELKEFLLRNYRLDQAWQTDRPVRWWHQTEIPPAYRLFTRK